MGAGLRRGDAHPYLPLDPVGARCASGRLDPEPREVNELREDVEAYVEERAKAFAGTLDPVLTMAERPTLKAHIHYIEMSIRAGRVEMGTRHGKPIRDVIVRLAHPRQPMSATSRKPRTARVYVAEPRHHDGVVIPLHLATKEESEHGSIEQNDAIDTAIRRAREWASPQELAAPASLEETDDD